MCVPTHLWNTLCSLHTPLTPLVPFSVLRESSGYTTKSASASREYVRKDLELWRPGSSFPAQGDLLALPFDFELPGRLPPSNYTEHKIGKAYCRSVRRL